MISLLRRVPVSLLLRTLGLALALAMLSCTDNLRSPPPFELGPAADAAPRDGGTGG